MEIKKCHCGVRGIIAAVIMLSVFVIDQIIKVAVKTNMCLYESIEVTDWFHIYFIENRGMAFGMDFVATSFLSLFRIIAIVIFLYLLLKIIRNKYPIGLIACLSLVVAGAMGNIIDNCCYGMIFTESTPLQVASNVSWGEGYGGVMSGKVVDMFYFPLFTWPDWVPFLGGDVFFGAVFNFADAAISCGAVGILLFYHKYLIGTKEGQKDSNEEMTDTFSEGK